MPVRGVDIANQVQRLVLRGLTIEIAQKAQTLLQPISFQPPLIALKTSRPQLFRPILHS